LGERLGTPGAANSAPPVNTPPEPAISGPTSALVGELVTYSGEDSSDLEDDDLTFTWNFSDGTTANGLEVSHTFTTAGNQSVSITVSDGAVGATAQLALTVTAPTYSDQVVINEVLPNPVGSDTSSEFIELKNIGSATVDLGGWQLDDQEGGSTPYTIAAHITIAPGALKVLTRAETKLALNNDTDTVRLLDPTGFVRATTTYTNSPKEGTSHNRLTSGQYQLSATPTSGSENTITSLATDDEDDEEESDEADTTTTSQGRVAGTTATTVPLADVREEAAGTLIQTEGVVSLPPGIFGKTMFYLAGSGIQVYSSAGAFPALKLGDKVKVVGELSANQGEARLKLTQATAVSVLASGPPPTPHRLATGEIDEEWEGSLVIMQGHVTETSGDTFFIDDGSGEVKVFIKETVKIDKPRLKKGAAITITGIVSETRSGYRVLPRFQEDIRLGLVAGLTSFPATGTPLLLISLLAFSMASLWLGVWHHEPLLTRSL
ncbi:MAG: lamin tail domain-containing protein, partial [Candidatus Andersenbacteria bacterium]